MIITLFCFGLSILACLWSIIDNKKKIDYLSDIINNDLPHYRGKAEYYEKKLKELKEKGQL